MSPVAKIIVVSRRAGSIPAPGGFRVVRVDRGTPLGNPYPMRTEAERDRVCESYDAWLARQIEDPESAAARALRRLFERYRRGEDLALACWCAPKRCHAESLRKVLLQWKREQSGCDAAAEDAGGMDSRHGGG